MTAESTVQTHDQGQWTVRLSGDVLQIIDAEGRERHRSMGHIMTGFHLAMALASRGPLESTGVVDEALRQRGEQS